MGPAAWALALAALASLGGALARPARAAPLHRGVHRWLAAAATFPLAAGGLALWEDALDPLAPLTGPGAWLLGLALALAALLLAVGAAFLPARVLRVAGPVAVGLLLAGLLLPLRGVLPPLVVLAAVALPRAVALDAATPARRLAAGLLGVVLVALALLGLLQLALAAAFGGPHAEHRTFAVLVSPETDAPYVLTVPFPASDDPKKARTLALLRDDLRVAEGNATLRLVEEGARIEIRGQGPVRVAASARFFGDADAGRLAGYRLATPRVDLAGPPGAAAHVQWLVNAGTCNVEQAFVPLRAVAGEPATLRAEGAASLPGAGPASCHAD